jgi:Flp pilus assembly protein TadG
MHMMMNRRRRDGRGAIAVVFAILSLVIFGVAAFAVDLGNAYQRKRAVQTQVDLAALAGAEHLPDQTGQAVAKVAEFLEHNIKLGQDQVWSLQDGDFTNGEVEFLDGNMRMKVTAPEATVDYRFAPILDGDFDSGRVSATATVAVGTPGGAASMPFYAFGGDGCDYGSRRLTDPANGKLKDANQVPTLTDPLTDPTKTSNATLVSADPPRFNEGAVGAQLNLAGSQLSQVARIAFLRPVSDGIAAVESTTFTGTNNNDVSGVLVPTAVTTVPGVWWIRVYKDSGNIGWSKVAEALPIRIGEEAIEFDECPGSNAGNFGSLKLPRTTNPATWLPDNIADGLEDPLSIAVHAEAADPWTCTPGGSGVVYSTTTGSPILNKGTNCVDTDTGLTANFATSGLVTGTALFPDGRLANRPTSSTANGPCGPGKSSASRSVLGKSINNDTLSCFMTNPSQPLSAIATAGYSGGPALDPAIFSSPRFCYVPVVKKDPTKGASASYSITDVRPCFITGETTASSYDAQAFRDGSDNGVTVTGTKVTTIHVLFFHADALPLTGPIGDYFGTGPKAVALVD